MIERGDREQDAALDGRNAAFWDELCGTHLARMVGATGRTPDDLSRFDRAFLDFYPYLKRYLPKSELDGARVLEIGLGYGTLGQLLIDRGASYTGVDIAAGPVEMIRQRISFSGRGADCDARQASALDLPFEDAAFDMVYSIGCLHHIGDLARGVAEVRRVLRPSGNAVVMLYNRWSARQVRQAVRSLASVRRRDSNERLRAMYDVNSAGNAAPHTDFVSVRQARRLFSSFRSVRVQRRNVSSIPHVPAARRFALATRIDQLVGLDLYVRAVA